MAGQFFCEVCEKCLATRFTLIRHQKLKHAIHHKLFDKIEKQQRFKSYKCDICGISLALKSKLMRHIRRHLSPRGKLKCPLDDTCDEICTHAQLVRHIKECHDIEVEVEEAIFPSREAFSVWKSSLRGFFTKRYKDLSLFMFCNRSGAPRKQGKNLRKASKPQFQTGLCCPARIVANFRDKVYVKFYKTHIGHTEDLRCQRLTREERLVLAGMLRTGASPDRILKTIKNSARAEEDTRRIHLVTRRDLYNISKEFNIRTTKRRMRTEKTEKELDEKEVHEGFANAAQWVQQLQQYGDDNPIVLYKVRGEQHPTLDENQFMLIMMTPYQKMMLWDAKQTGSLSRILVDSTDDCLGHEFQVATLAAIDESGAGCPLATCFCSYIDENSMTNFFLKIKEVVGTFDVDVFMSGDSFAYCNAWRSVMGEPSRVLLTTWHVEQAWRAKFVNIASPSARAKCFKELSILLSTTSQQHFANFLMGFMTYLESSPTTCKYAKYLKNLYGDRLDQWALCFRESIGIIPNEHLKAIHDKFMYCYLDGTQCRRLDKCIPMLLHFTRNLMLELVGRESHDEPADRMLATHDASLRITPVSHVVKGIYAVASPERDESYNVVISDDMDLCLGCNFTCPQCSVCPHRASCDCFDSEIRGNVCKHVHAGWMKLLVDENEEVEEKYGVEVLDDDSLFGDAELSRDVDDEITVEETVTHIMRVKEENVENDGVSALASIQDETESLNSAAVILTGLNHKFNRQIELKQIEDT